MNKGRKPEGLCAIKICKGKSSTWKTVTSLVLSKGANNKTLPGYIEEDNIICLNCYNAIVINVSSEFQQHALNWHDKPEASNENNVLFFSQAVEVITDILYKRERKALPSIWAFEEFRMLMESEDKRLKNFFDELYLSTNPSAKNKDTRATPKNFSLTSFTKIQITRESKVIPQVPKNTILKKTRSNLMRRKIIICINN
jgi:hypothetical protein